MILPYLTTNSSIQTCTDPSPCLLLLVKIVLLPHTCCTSFNLQATRLQCVSSRESVGIPLRSTSSAVCGRSTHCKSAVAWPLSPSLTSQNRTAILGVSILCMCHFAKISMSCHEGNGKAVSVHTWQVYFRVMVQFHF